MLRVSETTEDIDFERARLAEWIAHRKQLARTLIKRNEWPIGDHEQQEIICDEHERQREVVAKFGQCEGGCSDRNLRKHEFGHVVCRWTHEPCPRTELGELVEFFSILNGSDENE